MFYFWIRWANNFICLLKWVYKVNTGVAMRKPLSQQLIESMLVRFTLNLPEKEYQPFRLVHQYYQAYYYYLQYFKISQLKYDEAKKQEEWQFFQKINDCMPDRYRLLHSEIRQSIELRGQIPLCGAIVVSKFEEETVYLLVQDKRTGKYGFPKGKLQEGETLQQCAIRETRQQTSLKINCIFPIKKIDIFARKAYFFLARLHSSNQITQKSIKPQKNYEISEIVWATRSEIKSYKLNRPTQLAWKEIEN